MKILYSVQATGNGHISRAMELLPHLQQYGDVDIFLSGDNSSLALDAPIKYRSKGLSLHYNCNGGLDYWQIVKSFQLKRLKKEINDLPVEKYQLIINDFEYITAAACAKKKIPSVNFGHQASFQSKNTPRPDRKNITGEWVLKNYAKASRYIGLHFEQYDSFIFPPVIKKQILDAEPANKGYITVYLPSLCERQLKDLFSVYRNIQFQIFCSETKAPFIYNKHIQFLPVNKAMFNDSLVNCTGIVTGGGFETPAEAVHLGKKLLCIPIKGKYEQQCNAAALKKLGYMCLKNINDNFETNFEQWIGQPAPASVNYKDSIPQCLDYLFSQKAENLVDKPVIEATPSGLLSFLL